MSVAETQLIEPLTFPASLYGQAHAAQEPSVASAGKIVMYTLNWDAGYSVNGGQTFKEMDPHTVFPSTGSAAGGFCCDQVVIYDPSTESFIWLLQYQSNNEQENIIRVAYTTAGKLAAKGAQAWSSFDLSSRALTGVAGPYLDQPRVGLTARYLWINMNEGLSDKAVKTVVARIPRAGFAKPHGPGGYGWAALEPNSLRVAQSVRGSTEYFIGHVNTARLRIAWSDDSSNYIDTQDVGEPSIATKNWAIASPSGEDLLERQSESQTKQVVGVTQAGDGRLWAAWSEGRDVVDTNGNVRAHAAQPHIGVAVLSVTRPNRQQPPVFALVSKSEYVDPNVALAMPDLATDEAGEVAWIYYWGGGRYYLNQNVGFLSGELIATSVAFGNSDSSWTGNPAGDFETVRALPSPHGDCLVAAGDVNQGEKIGYAVFTIFSRQRVSCQTRYPVPPLPTPGPAGPVVSARARLPGDRR